MLSFFIIITGYNVKRIQYLRVVTSGVTCQRVADILLVLDQSTSIIVGDPNRDNWYVRVLGFAKSVAGAFHIARDRTQVAVIKFSDVLNVVFYLNTYSNRETLLNAIGNIDIDGGETNIAAALRTGRSMFRTSNGARNGVPKILIMLTDGTANVEEDETEKETNKTKADGIVIFTVGVGNDVDNDELRKIASKPEYFFFARDFFHLNSVLQKLLEDSCEEALLPMTTTATTTTTAIRTLTSSTTTTTLTTTTESCKSLLSYFLVALYRLSIGKFC